MLGCFTIIYHLKIWVCKITICHGNQKNIIFYFQGLFPPGQGATIGVDFMIKTVEIDGERVKVIIYFF